MENRLAAFDRALQHPGHFPKCPEAGGSTPQSLVIPVKFVVDVLHHQQLQQQQQQQQLQKQQQQETLIGIHILRSILARTERKHSAPCPVCADHWLTHFSSLCWEVVEDTSFSTALVSLLCSFDKLLAFSAVQLVVEVLRFIVNSETIGVGTEEQGSARTGANGVRWLRSLVAPLRACCLADFRVASTPPAPPPPISSPPHKRLRTTTTTTTTSSSPPFDNHAAPMNDCLWLAVLSLMPALHQEASSSSSVGAYAECLDTFVLDLVDAVFEIADKEGAEPSSLLDFVVGTYCLPLYRVAWKSASSSLVRRQVIRALSVHQRWVCRSFPATFAQHTLSSAHRRFRNTQLLSVVSLLKLMIAIVDHDEEDDEDDDHDNDDTSDVIVGDNLNTNSGRPDNLPRSLHVCGQLLLCAWGAGAVRNGSSAFCAFDTLGDGATAMWKVDFNCLTLLLRLLRRILPLLSSGVDSLPPDSTMTTTDALSTAKRLLGLLDSVSLHILHPPSQPSHAHGSSSVFAGWLSDIDDDSLIELCSEFLVLHNSISAVECASSTAASCTFVDQHLLCALDPMYIFERLMCSVHYDYRVILDFLISSETAFLDYFVRLMRHAGLRHHCPVDATTTTDRVTTAFQLSHRCSSALRELYEAVVRLRRKGLMPYNAGPLLRRIERTWPGLIVGALNEESG